MTDARSLMPELEAWNHGRGISPLDWLYCGSRSDHAIAFCDLFWPTFVVVDDCVLRSDYSEDGLREWKSVKASRQTTEGGLNVLSLVDLFVPNGEVWSELVQRRAIYLGQVLANIYRVKLARDFSDREFVVKLECEDGDGEIALSFWQAGAH